MTDQTLDTLDETLDDLADLPSSAPFPPGAHHCAMILTKNPKKPGNYFAKFKYKATLEFSNPADADSETAPKENDEAVIFINTKKKDGTTNEFGQGQLKQLAGPVGAMLGTNSVNEICLATKNGIDVIIVTGIRPAKDGYEASMTVSKIALYE